MHSAIVENTSSSVYLYMYVCVGEYLFLLNILLKFYQMNNC